MSKYFPERLWPRLVPQGSVMVSIYGPDSEQAYGVIGNISEGGAQVVAGVHFESGSRVLLRIGFDPDEPFSTRGIVVWSRDDSDEKHKSSYVHGVQFQNDDPEQAARLRAILDSRDFRSPALPGAGPTRAALDNMMGDLTDELEQLGERIENDS